jgi:hypothetical protein
MLIDFDFRKHSEEPMGLVSYLIIFYFIYGFQNLTSLGHLKMPEQDNINKISILQTARQQISVSQTDLSRPSQFTPHICNRPEDIVTYLLTYLLTPWRRVLLDKLTGIHLSSNSLHFMEPEGSMPHSQAPILSQIDPVHAPTFHFLKIHINTTLHLGLGLPSGLFPSGFPTKTIYSSPFPLTSYTPCLSHSSRFDHPNNIGGGVQINKLLIM